MDRDFGYDRGALAVACIGGVFGIIVLWGLAVMLTPWFDRKDAKKVVVKFRHGDDPNTHPANTPPPRLATVPERSHEDLEMNGQFEFVTAD